MPQRAGAGAKLGRGAGAAIQLVAKEGQFATLRLPSTEMRRVPIDCRAMVMTEKPWMPSQPRPDGNRVGLVGASAPRGRDEPFGKIHERGLIEKRRHCGW